MTPNEIKARVWREAAGWLQSRLDTGYPYHMENMGDPDESEDDLAAMAKEMGKVVDYCHGRHQRYLDAAALQAQKEKERAIKRTPDAHVKAFGRHGEEVAYETSKDNAVLAMEMFAQEVMAANPAQDGEVARLCKGLTHIRDLYVNQYFKVATQLRYDDRGLVIVPALKIATNKTLDPTLRAGLLLEIYCMVSRCYTCTPNLTIRVAKAMLNHDPKDDEFKSNLRHWHRRLTESYENTRAQYGKRLYGYGYDDGDEYNQDDGTNTVEYKILCLPGWDAVTKK